jgi:hypothetical protein
VRYSLVARHGRINGSETLPKPSLETSKPSIESTKRKTAIARETVGVSEISDSARLRICALRGGNRGENGGSEKHRAADFDQATSYAHLPLPISARTTECYGVRLPY